MAPRLTAMLKGKKNLYTICPLEEENRKPLNYIMKRPKTL